MGSLAPLLEILRYVVPLAIVIPVLIAVHELGHFWVARAFGMKVDSFAVLIGGIRKTKLEKYLPRPIAPAWQVWAFAVPAIAILVFGVAKQSEPWIAAGLVVVGIVIPVWVVSRLAALYHLSLAAALGTLVKTWGVAAALTFFGTRFQGIGVLHVLGMASIASLVGTALVYYRPVLSKPEDTPHGHGHIELPTTPVVEDDGATPLGDGHSALPVQFRPLASFKDRRGTEFSLLCWPLGGFAAIHGMHPKEDGSETEVQAGFYSKSPFARLMVLFAGPFFSMAFGVVLLAGVLTFSGEVVPSKEPVIGQVSEDGPAAKAGLKSGDRVLTVDGKPVAAFYDVLQNVRASVRHEGDKNLPIPVQFTIQRGSETLVLTAVPKVDEAPTPLLDAEFNRTEQRAIQARLLMGPEIKRHPLPIGVALASAAVKPIELVIGLADSIRKPAEIAENVGGPATIAKEVGQAAKSGIEDLVTIAGLLSISLGVMNLLPIGPLDGGQMVVALAELLRGGRRLSYQFQMRLTAIGAVLVIMLILGVVTIDIGRTAVR